MTANPFAALLDGVPRYASPDGNMLSEEHVLAALAALAAAVPDDLAEAGKVLDEIRRVDPFENPLAASEAEQRAADTIRSLLARIAAMEAQIKGHQDHVDTLNEVIDMSNATAQTLETALAAERAKTAKLVEALRWVEQHAAVSHRNNIQSVAAAAITEAGHE